MGESFLLYFQLGSSDCLSGLFCTTTIFREDESLSCQRCLYHQRRYQVFPDNLPEDRPFMIGKPRGGQLDPRSLSWFRLEVFPWDRPLMLPVGVMFPLSGVIISERLSPPLFVLALRHSNWLCFSETFLMNYCVNATPPFIISLQTLKPNVKMSEWVIQLDVCFLFCTNNTEVKLHHVKVMADFLNYCRLSNMKNRILNLKQDSWYCKSDWETTLSSHLVCYWVLKPS